MEINEENKPVDYYRDSFINLRNKIYSKTYGVGSIAANRILDHEYENLCADAAGGDVVAQDFLSYWFKNGSEVVPENIEMAMKWQILAGANGNKLSIEKMFVLFNGAYDLIVFLKDFDQISRKLDITKQNYQYILGRLLCEAVVDEMHLNALELAETERTKLEFNEFSMRKFDKAIQRATDTVVQYLRKL